MKLDFIVQSAGGNAEQLSRIFLHPVAHFQRFEDGLFFDIVQVEGIHREQPALLQVMLPPVFTTSSKIILARQREVLRRDKAVIICDQHCALDHVAQLTDVTIP